jgi:hypothetical protein
MGKGRATQKGAPVRTRAGGMAHRLAWPLAQLGRERPVGRELVEITR